MSKEFLYNDELLEETFDDEEFDEQASCLKDIDSCLTEEDFYPPCDKRTWKSGVEDIDGGDNFTDYCVEFYAMLDEEEYYDN